MLLYITRHTLNPLPTIVTEAKVQHNIYIYLFIYLFMIHFKIWCSLDSPNPNFLRFCFIQVDVLKSRSFLWWVHNSEVCYLCAHVFQALCTASLSFPLCIIVW